MARPGATAPARATVRPGRSAVPSAPYLRLCNVDVRGGTLFVQQQSCTSDGFWIPDGPVETMSAGASPVELGRAVVRAILNSRQNVVPPPPHESLSAALLAAAGVQSWKQYMRGARSVDIEALPDDLGVRIVSMRSGAGGFLPLDGEQLLRGPQERELGQGVLDGLRRGR